MSYRLTILGCGSSGGVPRLGPAWGACDPTNPKNRRRRSAVLVEHGEGDTATRVLIDTPPDLREQLLDAGITRVDGVLYTHDHADHTHGIDDLRALAYAMKKRVNVHADGATLASLTRRFSYCFEQPPGSGYRPILEAHVITPGAPVQISGANGAIEAIPIPQKHGDITSLGFRFGPIAYSPDLSDVPPEGEALLEGLEVWIVDALRHAPHPSHFHVSRALEWIRRVGARRAVLTHMTAELDYAALRRELPPNVEPAYDGMVINFG